MNDEIKNIKLKQEIARKAQLKEIADKVTQKIQELSKIYLKLVNPKDLNEVSRRFSMLTRQYIGIYLEKLDCVLQTLNMSSSAAQLLERLLSLSVRIVIVRPDIGMTKCDLVRKRVAGFISRILTQIKNNRLKCIKDNLAKNKQKVEKSIVDKPKTKRVVVGDSAQIIGESLHSYDEFIGDFKNISNRTSEKTVRATEYSFFF